MEEPSGTLVTAQYQSEWVDHRLSRLKQEIESPLGLPSDPATYKPEVWADPRPLPRRDGIGDGAAALALGLSWVSAVTMPALLGSPAREAVPIVTLATLASDDAPAARGPPRQRACETSAPTATSTVRTGLVATGSVSGKSVELSCTVFGDRMLDPATAILWPSGLALISCGDQGA